MDIVGVSFDTTTLNQTWATNEGFQYDLWSDDRRVLALYYGAATIDTQPAAYRITRLLDADGNVVLEYPVTDVGTHPQDVLDDCTILFGP